MSMSLEDKVDQAKGALKETVGKVTDDKKTEFEGAAEKTTAKVKDVAEDVKDAAEEKSKKPRMQQKKV
nr:MAG TPA: Protein yjbJ [Caudoviricetes sp.]